MKYTKEHEWIKYDDTTHVSENITEKGFQLLFLGYQATISALNSPFIDQFHTFSEALIGITDHAQSELGDIVHVEFNEPGDLSNGDALCTIESVKSTSEVFIPFDGTHLEVRK